jgi:tagaturonate reductase
MHLLFSFAAIVEFHKGKRGNEDIALKDDPELLAHWAKLWAEFDGNYETLAQKALAWTQAWEMDMNTIHPDITKTVAKFLKDIDTNGMKSAVEGFVNE